MLPPLKGIRLYNYRNFQKNNQSFQQYHTLFKGKNAVGKTNLLEAISFLCPGTGFRKDSIQNLPNEYQKEEKTAIDFEFIHEDLTNKLKIEFCKIEDRWSKNYFLNDKKIQQQDLLKTFQLFWFTETDKVFFIRDTQYQRNTINRIICYFDQDLFINLNKYKRLRREKRKILQSTKDISWLQSIDTQLLEIGDEMIESKILFLKSFLDFLNKDKNEIYQFEIDPSYGFKNKEDFMSKFNQDLKDENQWPQDHKLRSENDPLKSIFEITHNQKKLSQLSSAQSKLVILSFLLQCAKFLNKNKITIFLIDEIFDNFDIVNIEKVIKYCAKNKFQTFFSTTDNFVLQGAIKDLEIKEIT